MTHIELLDSFRSAMRRFATTVALITSCHQGHRFGMAATAVASVSADPPTLLVVVNRGASIHPTLQTNELFCVNLLSTRHGELVPAFGGGVKGDARFKEGDWREGPGGVPVLNDALASVICRSTVAIEVGTHTIFVGEVEHVFNHPQINPLIWVDGGLGELSQYC